MNKQEFLDHAHIKNINQEDYNVIEEVYTNHPSISNTNGKAEISTIYNLPGGMRIIRDMLPTANKAQEINDKRVSLRGQLQELDRWYTELKG